MFGKFPIPSKDNIGFPVAKPFRRAIGFAGFIPIKIKQVVEEIIARIATWLDDWEYRTQISISSEDITSDLTHFPVAVVLGDFAKSPNQDVNDDFTGKNGDLPNSDLWIVNEDLWSDGLMDASITIQNNKLNIPSDSSNYRGNICSNFKLRGDFDIQVDWDSTSTGTVYLAILYFWVDLNNRTMVYATLDNIYNNFHTAVDGTWDTTKYLSRSNNYGTFRLIRTGTQLTAQCKDGDGSFTTIGTTTFVEDDGYVVFFQNHYVQNVGETNFDNFKVNSGTVIWPNTYVTNVNNSDALEKLRYQNRYPFFQEDKILPDTSIIKDSFTGNDGDAPNTDLWQTPVITTDGVCSIQSNALRMAITSASANQYTYVNMKYDVSGDFDFQVDFSDLTLGTGAGIGGEIAFDIDGYSYRLYVKAGYYSGLYFLGHSYTTSGSENSVTRTNNYGGLRITRIGTTAKLYYKDGDGDWTLLHTRTSFLTHNGYIRLALWITSGYSGEIYWDNLKINSGKLAYPDVFEDKFKTLDESRWYINNSLFMWSTKIFDYVIEIESNRVKYTPSGTASTNAGKLVYKYLLNGDFDIQVDIEASTSVTYASMYAVEAKHGGSSFRCGRESTNIIAGASSYGSVAYSNDTFSIRITRVGNIFTGYYDNAGTWTSIYSATFSFSSSIFIVLYSRNITSQIVYFDNFKINYGNYKYLPFFSLFDSSTNVLPDSSLLDVTNNSVSGVAVLSENSLNVLIPSTANDESIYIDSVFSLQGDFDIQVDYEIVSSDAPSSSYSYPTALWVKTDSEQSLVGIWMDSTGTQKSTVDGSSTTQVVITEVFTTGAFRITRTGSVLKGYYFDTTNLQWEWNGSTSGYTFSETFTDNATIRLRSTAGFDSGCNIAFSNLIINSVDNIIYPDVTGDYTQELHPNRKKVAFSDEQGNQLFGEIETFKEQLYPIYDFQLGSNRCNDLGWTKQGTPSDMFEYYHFNGYDSGLSYGAIFPGDADLIDIEIRFMPTNKDKSAQCLWKTGGNSNGICLGIDASGYVGIFGRSTDTLTSITTNVFEDDEWYILKASKIGIVLIKESDNTKIEVEGNITCGVGTSYMSIGYTYSDSIITGVSSTNADFFEGCIDYVKIFVESDSLRYICGAGYAVYHVSHPDFVISSQEDTLMSISYDRDKNDNIYYIGNTSEGSSFDVAPTPNLNPIVDDDFTGKNGDLPNSDLWIVNADLWGDGEQDSTIIIKNNKINFQSDNNSKGNVTSTFKLRGDFDVQVDWDSTSTSTDWLAGMFLWVTDENRSIINATVDTDYFNFGNMIEGVWDTLQSVSRQNTYGSFRLIRNGDRLIAQYKDGSGSWMLIGVGICVENDCHIVLHQNHNGATGETNFDNFKVNSGTIIENANLSDNFIGKDGSLPDPDRYTQNSDTYPALIYDNKLYLESINYNMGVNTKYLLSGDFDIQVDYELSLYPSTDSWGIGLIVVAYNSTSVNQYICRREYSSAQRYKVYGQDNGTVEGEATVSTSDTSGKLKITRVGNVFTGYYYNGSSWVSIGSTTITGADSFPMYVRIMINDWDSSVNAIGYLSNFIINYGTIISKNRINFTGEDGSLPNNELWKLSNTSRAFIYNNKLRLFSESYCTCKLLCEFPGDFDIQVDLDVITGPSTNSWSLGLRVLDIDSSDILLVSRRYASSHYFSTEIYISETWTTITTSSSTVTSGKLRITRVGTLFSFYYNISSTWVSLSSYTVDFGSVYIDLEHGPWDSPDEFVGDFTNFTINSADDIIYYPAQHVWDNNFVGVYHMAQDQSSESLLDSTKNLNNGTSTGTMTSDDLVDGDVGKAIDFDGVDDYIYTTAESGTLDIIDTLTIETITKLNDIDFTALKGLLSRQHIPTSDQNSYSFHINTSEMLQLGSYGGNIQGQVTDWSTNKYFYLVGTYESTDLNGDLYIDGNKETLSTDNYDTMESVTNSLAFGVNSTSEFLNGSMSEVRISNIVRSDIWIKTTYNSISNNLLTFNDPEKKED